MKNSSSELSTTDMLQKFSNKKKDYDLKTKSKDNKWEKVFKTNNSSSEDNKYNSSKDIISIFNKEEYEWKLLFKDAELLPVVGYPSTAKGVATLTHSICKMSNKINDLKSQSILANNAFYSFESACDRYLNLYEVTLPNIPGRNGRPSTVEVFVNKLRDNDLDVAGVNFKWFGGKSANLKKDKGLVTVNVQKANMNPCEFTRKTLSALKKALKVIAMYE
jgi:hypothetical protein